MIAIVATPLSLQVMPTVPFDFYIKTINRRMMMVLLMMPMMMMMNGDERGGCLRPTKWDRCCGFFLQLTGRQLD